MSTKDRLELLQGTLDLLILRTLQLGPSHGHSIAKAIEHSSDDALLVQEGFGVSLLYGVTPTDPATFIVVPSVLMGVALLACLVPAWAAARLDPVEVQLPSVKRLVFLRTAASLVYERLR